MENKYIKVNIILYMLVLFSCNKDKNLSYIDSLSVQNIKIIENKKTSFDQKLSNSAISIINSEIIYGSDYIKY